MSRYKRYQFVYQISWKRLRAFRSSKLLLNERKEKELYVFLRSSAKTGAARSKSETLNRALLSSFLAEFSDFEGMLGLYTCNTDSSSPPFLPPPPPPPAHLSSHDRHPNQLALSTFSPLSRSRRGCPCRC